MIAKGVNGQVEIVGAKIVISRKGAMAFMTHGFKGDKEILISQISSIQYKQAGMMTNGYIQFAFIGGQEAKRGLLQSTQDENSIVFSRSQQPHFDELKAEIDRIRDSLDREVPAAPMSGLDELEKLAALKDKGVITEDEFQEKKKQILGL